MGFFDFLGKSAQDFAGGVGNVFKTAGDVSFNFLKGATTPAPQIAVQSQIDKTRQQLLSDTRFQQALNKNPNLKAQFDQTATPAQTPADMVAGAVQAIPRAIKSGGLTVRGQDQYTPAPGLEQAIYGQAPIKNLTGSGRDLYSTGGALVSGGKDTKAGESINPALATGIGALGATLDVFPGNPLKFGGKQVIEQLAKDATESAVKKTLKNSFTPDVVQRIAPAIAQAKDPNIIRNILTDALPVEKQASHVTTEANLPSILQTGKLNGDVPTDLSTGRPLPEYEGQNAVYLQSGKNNPYGFAGENNVKIVYNRDNLPAHTANGNELAVNGSLPVTPQTVNHIEVGNPNLVPALEKRGFLVKYDPKLNVQQLADASVPGRPLSGAALQASEAKNITTTPLDQLGGARPENVLQTKFETALNSGDIKGAQAAIDQIPDQTIKAPLQSILDKTKPQDIVSATVPKVQEAASPLDEITNALNGQPATKGQSSVKGIASVSAENKKLLSQERGQRFAASESVGKTAEGSQGYYKELSQLKGEYTKTKLGGMIENIGPQRAEELFSAARQKIQAVPDSTYDQLGYFPKSARLNTQTAIRKVIFGEGGGVPTTSELKLIRVINPKLAENIESRIPKQRKLFDIAAKLAGIPRALQSSFDLSMGGRQGLLVATRNPVLWARANKESIKYLKSSKYFDSEMSAIRKTPEYALGDKYGLATPAADLGREESFAAADYAEKIPGIKASERAYNGGLTKLRSDLWAKTIKAYGGVDKVEGELGAKGMQDLAEAVNTLTGRGGKKGGFVEKHMTSLAETLFAPRLWAARLNTLNPTYYARLSPAARKVALENAGSFAAVAGVVLGAGAALGGQVETDPRSSDFLKIKFGDTRYDILGGLQQNIVFAWREITGEKKSTQTGETTKFAKNLADIVTGKSNEKAGVDTGFGKSNRLNVAADLFTNKLAPIPAAVVTQLEGKDRGGNEINPAAEIAKLFIPINATGVYETSQDTGSVASGAALNVPSFFGIGTQTYGVPSISLSEKQKATVEQLQSKGAPQDYIDATTRFYQTQKTAPDRNKASASINQALASGDHAKAIQLAKDYNSKYAASFKDWLSKYDKYASDKTLTKEYASGRIKLTASSIQQRLKNIKTNPLYAGE